MMNQPPKKQCQPDNERQSPSRNENQTPTDNELMREFIAALKEYVQQNREPKPVSRFQVIKLFQSLNPPQFNGRDGPLAAEAWLHSLDKIFTLIDCTEELKLSCGVFQLIEDASWWWESHTTTMNEQDKSSLTWATFKEIVLDKYFPTAFRHKLEMEFYGLEQGNTTVEEYERKFIRLARYAPYLVDTEGEMVSRFRRGLRREIGAILAGAEIDKFDDVVRRAQAVAASLHLDDQVGKGGKRKAAQMEQ